MADVLKEIDISSPEVRMLIEQVLMGQQNFEKHGKIDRFRILNQYVRSGQILFAGSSLMEQFPIHELLTDLELPYAIYNRGIGGYTTPELLDTLDVCIYDVKPAYIFINIGTNDMNGPDYELQTFLDRYEQILQGIREHLPDAKVYVLAYYPVNPNVGTQKVPAMAELFRYRTNQRIQEANAGVEALAAKMGMQYLDLNEGLTDEDGNLKAEFTVEGIHIYGNGYRVILENLLPVLTGLIENSNDHGN